MLTITAISTGITSILFFVGGVSVYSSWRRTKQPDIKFFSIFLISFGFQQLFFSLGTGPASDSPVISNWLWAIAHIFMFIGISYFLRFPVRIRFPRLEKLIFKITIFYSIIGSLIIFYSIPKVEPFLLENGVYNWKVPPLAGATIGIFTTVCLLLSLVIFARGYWEVEDRILKARSLILSLGLLIFLIAGPLHNFITTPLLNVVACSSLVIGSFLMVLGVYLPRLFPSQQQS